MRSNDLKCLRPLVILLCLAMAQETTADSPTQLSPSGSPSESSVAEKSQASPSASTLKETQRTYQVSPSAEAAGNVVVEDMDSAAKVVTAPVAPSASTAPVPDPARFRAMSAGELAQYLTGERPFAGSMWAVQEALARGGIATIDHGQFGAVAYAPASPFRAVPLEIIRLTREIRQFGHQYTLTLADLANSLRDLGWPFTSERSAASQLAEFLAEWVAEAKKTPSAPDSFTPLFLAELARQRVPAVDLSVPAPRLESIRLTMLELELFTAAFDRYEGVSTTSNRLPFSPDAQTAVEGETTLAAAKDAATLTAGVNPGSLPAFPLWRGLMAYNSPGSSLGGLPLVFLMQAAASDPCEYLFDSAKEALGLSGSGSKQTGGAVGGKSLKPIIKSVLKHGGVSDQALEGVDPRFAAASMLSQLLKTAAIYGLLEVSVERLSAERLHKPMAGELLAGLRAQIKYRTDDGSSLPPEERSVLDKIGEASLSCLGADSSPAAYSVEWTIAEGAPEHVEMADPDANDVVPTAREAAKTGKKGFIHQFVVRKQLEFAPDSGYFSLYFIRIKNEPEELHPSLYLSAPAKVCAEVDTTKPPTVSTLLGPIPTSANPAGIVYGAAVSIADLLNGLFRKIVKPKACESMQVTFCEKYSIEVKRVHTARVCQKSYCFDYSTAIEVTIPLEGDENAVLKGKAVGREKVAGDLKGASWAKGSGQREVIVEVNGVANVFTNMARMKVSMSGVEASYPITGCVPGACGGGAGKMAAIFDAECNEEVCSGFEIPIKPDEQREWTMDYPIGKQTITVAFRKR